MLGVEAFAAGVQHDLGAGEQGEADVFRKQRVVAGQAGEGAQRRAQHLDRGGTGGVAHGRLHEGGVAIGAEDEAERATGKAVGCGDVQSQRRGGGGERGQQRGLRPRPEVVAAGRQHPLRQHHEAQLGVACVQAVQRGGGPGCVGREV